jgi:hypothetical protein
MFQIDLVDFCRLRKQDPYGVLMHWVLNIKGETTGLRYLCALPGKCPDLVVYKLQEILGATPSALGHSLWAAWPALTLPANPSTIWSSRLFPIMLHTLIGRCRDSTQGTLSPLLIGVICLLRSHWHVTPIPMATHSFHEFVPCPHILPSAASLLDHIRGSKDQVPINKYLIHLHHYQISKPHTAF